MIIPHIHHKNRNIVLHTMDDGGAIHDFQTAVDHIDILQRIKLDRFGFFLDPVIDAIHLGGFDDHVCVDFGCAQSGGCIR